MVGVSCAPRTIAKRRSWRGGPWRVRRRGGGRKRIEAKVPEVIAAWEALVDPLARGDPESLLRWTSKSTYKLAAELQQQG